MKIVSFATRDITVKSIYGSFRRSYSKIIVVISVVFLTACENAAKFNSTEQVTGLEKKQTIPKQDFSVDTSGDVSVLQPQVGIHESSNRIDWDKKIVKNSNVNIEVSNSRKFRQSVAEWIRESGGYIAKEDQEQNNNRIENSITIKVPVDEFEVLLSKIISDSVKIISKTINTEDVTGEFVDVRARLEAKRQVRMRYLDFLRQAKNMEEVLLVQKEVNELQEQMESASERINYLSQGAVMSTIHLSYYDFMEAPKKIIEDTMYLMRLFDSIKGGAYWVGELLLLVVSLWPFLIAVILATVLYKRNISRKDLTK